MIVLLYLLVLLLDFAVIHRKITILDNSVTISNHGSHLLDKFIIILLKVNRLLLLKLLECLLKQVLVSDCVIML